MGFLDQTGLARLWSRCKAQFAPKDHSHNDLYYTESEVDELIANIGETSVDLSDYLPLSGGTMTGEIFLNGGDGVGKGKIALRENGQITDASTSTLFGRMSSDSGSLYVGSTGYTLKVRGKASRPTYNGSNMALISDIPSGSLSAVDSETFTYNGG